MLTVTPRLRGLIRAEMDLAAFSRAAGEEGPGEHEDGPVGVAHRRRLPAHQGFVAGLRIRMPQSVHVLQPRNLALPIVDVALLDVCFVGWNQCPFAGKLVRLVECRTLLRRGDWNHALSATFRPRAFDFHMVASAGIARLKLGYLFAAQAEVTLQFQADAHVRISYFVQLVL